MTISKLTSDQTAAAVLLVKAYDKAGKAIERATASQGQSGVEFISIVSPSVISIYEALSNRGELIGKRTSEAADMTTAISELLETTGLKPNHSLSKRTIAICSSWYVASTKLGDATTPLSTILDNAETMKAAKGSIEEMVPRPAQSPQDMVAAFVERFNKAHPNDDLVALVFDSVDKAATKAATKAA
tara:strand:- start:912 stop:1472 length:561 start_codon:yes stop_codon:yes gene_type:complete